MNIGYFEKLPPQQGWQCPVCGRVYSPTTIMCLMCLYRGNEKEIVSSDYSFSIDYTHHDTVTKTEDEE